MKREWRDFIPLEAEPQKMQMRKPARPIKVLTAEQRKRLPYSWSTSPSPKNAGSSLFPTQDGSKTSERPACRLTSKHDIPVNVPKPKLEIRSNVLVQSLSDIVIRRPSDQAASVIDARICRQAIHLHPTRSDLLLGKHILYSLYTNQGQRLTCVMVCSTTKCRLRVDDALSSD